MAGERAMLPQCFAFDHPNYYWYLTAQHVNLSALSTQESETWEDLLANGFGGSLSGEPFSTIHGDPITETTINWEGKVRGGPMHGGYSISEEPIDAFIKTSHIMVTIRSKLKEKLAYVTSSAHEEITPGSKIQHDNVVKDLNNQQRDHFNPFIDAPLRHFTTVVEIERDVIKDSLNSWKIGEESYETFINERIKWTDEKKNKHLWINKMSQHRNWSQEKSQKQKRALTFLKKIDKHGFLLEKSEHKRRLCHIPWQVFH